MVKHSIPILHLFVQYITEVLTNVEIPPTVIIGKGFIIYHSGPVLINCNVVIGDNVSVRPGVVIGGDFEGRGAPVLGNNIDIGVGAKILGNIILGNNINVGANAVVTKSFQNNSTLVGVPARNISDMK